jgi:hypothetical protein
LIPVIILCGLIGLAGRHYWLQSASHSAEARPTIASLANHSTLHRAAATVETRHYTISSTATPSQTALVGNAVESLYETYAEFFGDAFKTSPDASRLQLVLYKDQGEFKANNRSKPWAEAYYRPPICHAYYADGGPNPYHWMLHEATHQLNNEVAHFPRTTWTEEGLASYFSTSRIEQRKLVPGKIDANAYPIWWLPSLFLTGNLQDDIRGGRIIPLRNLIASGRDDIGKNVNLHYIEYWSLTHFLFHYRNGLYSDRYRQLIKLGGSLEDLERLLGPVDKIQVQWYGYLQELRSASYGRPEEVRDQPARRVSL